MDLTEKVVLVISNTERIVKANKPNGAMVLSHQHFIGTSWRPCCHPIGLKMVSEEKGIEQIKNCSRYGKWDV